MNRLSKIFLAIIFILIIALGIAIHSCIRYKTDAENNLHLFLNTTEEFWNYRITHENCYTD